MRRAAKVDENQSAIVKALRQAGCSVAITSAVGDGFVDIVVGRMGQNFLVELKDGDKSPSERKLTPAQERWHRAWRGQKAVAENVEQAFRAVGLLRGGT